MRRPRKKLEVSTFPFLAVLLCIMGSLMLLLFIMDRRAKIAARYRVEEELQARKKRTKEEEDTRQAEWEKAKQQLHASLLAQNEQLLTESKGLNVHLGDAGNKLALVQAKHTDLNDKIKDESARIGALYLEIEAQRAGLQKSDSKVQLSKAELIEAAKELAELERAFQQLRALKDREKQVYSVVPYRGKRGDLRPPIYVECVGSGVVFHPDKTPLQGWEFTAAAVRGEVEKRFGPLTPLKPPTDKDAAKGPYVLFLVRPSGIASYYKAQAALKGVEVDFGYELVDESWALDFSGDTHAKNGPPSRPGVPWKGDEPKPIVLGPPPGSGSSGVPTVGIQSPGGIGGGTPGVGNVAGPSLTPGGSGIRGGLPAPPNGSGIGSGLPAPPSGSGLGSGLPAPPSGGGPSNPGNSGGTPKPPAFVPIAKGAQGGNGGSPGVGSIGAPIPGSSGAGQGVKTPGQSGNASDGGGGKSPSPGSSGAGQGGAKTPGQTGNASDGGGGMSPIPFGDPTQKPPPTPPLSKLLGNKDFLITIDCRNDAVTITPSGLIYRWTAANGSETDAALVQTVTNLIARRQASVRPGEPPYRPIICFRVAPDGLRTYLRAYPLLERLNVAMTRENVVEE